eukprot:4841800-Ditylum_brightwellii.AAC.1
MITLPRTPNDCQTASSALPSPTEGTAKSLSPQDNISLPTNPTDSTQQQSQQQMDPVDQNHLPIMPKDNDAPCIQPQHQPEHHYNNLLSIQQIP